MAISGFVCLKTDQWRELQECPDWRGSYITVAVCMPATLQLAPQPQLRLMPAINEGRKKGRSRDLSKLLELIKALCHIFWILGDI